MLCRTTVLCLALQIAAAVGDCVTGLAPGAILSLSVGGWNISKRLADIVDEGELADGLPTHVPCWRAHNGYDGALALSCSGGRVVADASACIRGGCLQPGQFVERSPSLEAAVLRVDGLEGKDLGSPLWTDFVRTRDGGLLAAPTFGKNALVITPNGAVRTFGDAGEGVLKYYSLAADEDRLVAYAMPFFADRVLRIDVESNTTMFLGPSFPAGGNKWHGAAFAAGAAWGVPFDHTHVLRARGLDVSLVGDLGDMAPQQSKWWAALALGNFILGIPCAATKLLLVDAAARTVKTFGGPFEAAYGKWKGAVVIPGSSVAWALPFDHGRALRVDVAGQIAQVLGPDFGSDPGKWTSAVLASDATIFGIPGSALAVLRVFSDSGEVRAFGSVPAGPGKWASGAFAASGLVLGVPATASTVLVVDPADESVSFGNISGAAGLDAAHKVNTSRWRGAMLASTGAVYAAPNEVPAVLRLGAERPCLEAPELVNVTCDMGAPCTVELAAPHQSLSHVLLVLRQGWCGEPSARAAAFAGWTNPQVASFSPGAEAQSVYFEFGVASSGAPLLAGVYRLCWGDNPQAGPNGEAYNQDVGWLTLLGPHPLNTSCTLGQACTVELAVGRGLRLGDELAVLTSEDAPALLNVSGLVNPASNIAGGVGLRHFDFGTPRGATPGVYPLRWRRSGDVAWRVELGSLSLVGPRAVGALECGLGEACSMTLHGLGLAASDGLVLRHGDSCAPWGASFGPSHRLPGWCAPPCSAVSVAAGGAAASFVLGARSDIEATSAAAPFVEASALRPRSFTMCWAPSVDGNAASEVMVGVLTVRGPAMPVLVTCTLGVPCSVVVSGYGLLGTDVLMVAAAGMGCRRIGDGQAQLADLGLPPGPALVATLDQFGNELWRAAFDLGVPHRGALANYTLCWEAMVGHAGQQRAAVDVGTLQLLENSCEVEAPRNAATPPCMQGGVVPHLGACDPQCEVGFDPFSDEMPLRCTAGELSPSGFECLQRCGDPPAVDGAVAQAHCADMKHGHVCEVSCPVGHVKSGDFVCSHGSYFHVSSLELKGDLSWPPGRCFQPCDVGTISAIDADARVCANTTGSIVVHGDSCFANCPAGAVAYDPDGLSLRPSLQCRDGAFEMLEYRCVAGCGAPLIADALDLSRCMNLAHGESCAFACRLYYKKTGDIYCQFGRLSEASCAPPCNVLAIWPQPIAKAKAFPCLGLGEYVVHGQTCQPDCVEGFSNRHEDDVLICQAGSLYRIADVAAGVAGVANAPFVCYANCPGKPPAAIVPNSEGSDRCVGLFHGQECPVACLADATGSGSVVCMDGQFQGVGACVKSCAQRPKTDGATTVVHCPGTKHGESCKISCKGDYTQIADPVCLDGAWEREDLCMRACHVNAATGAQCEGDAVVKHGAECRRLCREGFETDAVATCVDGDLLPADFTCWPIEEYVCGAAELLGVLAADAASCAGTAHGGLCEVGCQTGFEPHGVLTCSWGAWSSRSGDVCADKRPRCPGLAIVKHGTLHPSCADALVGKTCPVVCGDGFEPGAKLEASCLAGASWETGAHCVRTSCGMPAQQPHANMECNGENAADYCVVECHVGYGSGGELYCVEAADATWQWRARTPSFSSSTSGAIASLCQPLACLAAAFVPNVSRHNCDDLPHGSSCTAFDCEPGFVDFGVYRCEFGVFVEFPSCIAAARARGVPAAAAPMRVEVTARWGSLGLGRGWGQRVAGRVERTLQRALVERQAAVKVTVLGWTESRLEDLSSNALHAITGIQVTYVVAAVPPPSTDDSAASSLAADFPRLLSVSALTSAEDPMEPPLLGYGGEVSVSFRGLRAAPAIIYLGEPAPTSSPTGVPTAPPTRTPTSLVVTTTPPLVSGQTKEDTETGLERFVNEHGIFVVACVSVSSCLCVFLTYSYRRHAAKHKSETFRMAITTTERKDLVGGKATVGRDVLVGLANLNVDEKKGKVCTLDKMRAEMQGAMTQSYEETDQKIAASMQDTVLAEKERRHRDSVRETVYGLVEKTSTRHLQVLSAMHVEPPQIPALTERIVKRVGGVGADIHYIVHDQGDYEFNDDLPDDFVKVESTTPRRRGLVEVDLDAEDFSIGDDDEDSHPEVASDVAKGSQFEDAIDVVVESIAAGSSDAKATEKTQNATRSAWRATAFPLAGAPPASEWRRGLFSMFTPTARSGAEPKASSVSSSRVSGARSSRPARRPDRQRSPDEPSHSSGQPVTMTMKQRGLSPGGHARNMQVVHNSGKSALTVSSIAEPMRNFKVRAPNLLAISEEINEQIKKELRWENATEEQRHKWLEEERRRSVESEKNLSLNEEFWHMAETHMNNEEKPKASPDDAMQSSASPEQMVSNGTPTSGHSDSLERTASKGTATSGHAAVGPDASARVTTRSRTVKASTATFTDMVEGSPGGALEITRQDRSFKEAQAKAKAAAAAKRTKANGPGLGRVLAKPQEERAAVGGAASDSAGS